ncbi:MAG: hypothetical protein V4671_29000 [Armatimonadota bacterium]
MGILKRIFGRDEDVETEPGTPSSVLQQPVRQGTPAGQANLPQDPDSQAIERYRYMLKTAPPEMLEQAHTEAFAKLTPEQRQQVLSEMSQDIPQAERPMNDDPQALARAATRAEMRQPGYMERTFGGMGMGGAPMMGGGMSMGGLIGGSLLTSIAGSFIGSSIAHSFFAGPMGMGFGGHGDGPDVVNNYYGDQDGNNGNGRDSSSDANTVADSNDTGSTEVSVDDSSGFDMLDGGDFGGDMGGLDI